MSSLEQNLKNGFRLNRFIGWSVIIYQLFGFLSLSPKEAGLWQSVILVLCLVISVAYLLVSEWAYRKLVKPVSGKNALRSDPAMMDRITPLFGVVNAVYLLVNYLLVGQVGLLLLMVFPVVQAQLFSHLRLSRLMMAVFALVSLSSLITGYPHLIGFSNALSVLRLPVPVFLLMQMSPFVVTLFYYTQTTAGLMVNTQERVGKLQNLAATDGLTGLINRRQFNHQLQGEVARARRNKKPLSLALFDIDDFKKINDHFGHPMGDRILRELGALVTQNVRESDIPARYGGEEFALVLPETRQIEAYEMMERLRKRVEGTVFCMPEHPMTITVSIGIAQLDPRESTVFELVELADQALYQAKRQGKNCVVYGAINVPKLDISSQQPQF